MNLDVDSTILEVNRRDGREQCVDANPLDNTTLNPIVHVIRGEDNPVSSGVMLEVNPTGYVVGGGVEELNPTAEVEPDPNPDINPTVCVVGGGMELTLQWRGGM